MNASAPVPNCSLVTTAAVPTIGFSSDANTGFYRSGPEEIRLLRYTGASISFTTPNYEE